MAALPAFVIVTPFRTIWTLAASSAATTIWPVSVPERMQVPSAVIVTVPPLTVAPSPLTAALLPESSTVVLSDSL